MNSPNSLNGYTLLAPISSTETYLLDNCGRIVNVWNSSTYNPGAAVSLLSDGTLLRSCKLLTGNIIAGGSGGRLERYDWNDSLIWSYNIDSPSERQHHDFVHMPNGNILILAWDVKSRQEAILHGLDTNHYNGTLWSEKLIEIEPLGSDSARIVWEWYLWDHMVQDFDTTRSNYGQIDQNPQLVDLNYFNNNGISPDYFHANGLDYNPQLDQIIISVRNYDEFWIIDHSTTTAEAAGSSGGNTGKGGDILYRWGNPETYQRGGLAQKKLFGMHNPNWVKQGFRDEGKIMVFNNGYNDTNQVSKVQLIDPPLLPNNNYAISPVQAYGPLNPSWSYTMPVFVDFVSGATRLSNGNTFISSGPDGAIYELDSMDNLVWKYVSPAGMNGTIYSQGSTPTGNTLYRSERYAESYPAFTNRNIVPRNRLELNPLPFNCTIYSNSVGIAENVEKEKELFLWQNPISHELKLMNKSAQPTLISVYDLKGSLVHSSVYAGFEIRINSSNWPNQLYLVRAVSGNKTAEFKVMKQ